MCDHFGIRIGSKTIAACQQSCAYFVVILDDAVMNDGESIVADVRMGVSFRRNAMGGPAGVSDANIAMHSGLCRHFGKRGNPAGTPKAIQPAVDHRDTGGIVTAVFQLAQSLQQDRHYVSPSYGANDSAHKYRSIRWHGSIGIEILTANFFDRTSPAGDCDLFNARQCERIWRRILGDGTPGADGR